MSLQEVDVSLAMISTCEIKRGLHPSKLEVMGLELCTCDTNTGTAGLSIDDSLRAQIIRKRKVCISVPIY